MDKALYRTAVHSVSILHLHCTEAFPCMFISVLPTCLTSTSHRDPWIGTRCVARLIQRERRLNRNPVDQVVCTFCTGGHLESCLVSRFEAWRAVSNVLHRKYWSFSPRAPFVDSPSPLALCDVRTPASIFFSAKFSVRIEGCPPEPRLVGWGAQKHELCQVYRSQLVLMT